MNEQFGTTDLWFASFLMLKNYTISDYKRDGKVTFYFEIAEEDVKKLKLEFSNSDISKIKWNQEKLKDLIHQ